MQETTIQETTIGETTLRETTIRETIRSPLLGWCAPPPVKGGMILALYLTSSSSVTMMACRAPEL